MLELNELSVDVTICCKILKKSILYNLHLKHPEMLVNFTVNHPGGGIGERLALTVSEFMNPISKISVEYDEDFSILGKKFDGNPARMIVLTKRGKFLGCLSSGDYRRLSDNTGPRETLSLSDLNVSPQCVSANNNVADVISMMKENNIDVAFVTENEKIIGYAELRHLL